MQEGTSGNLSWFNILASNKYNTWFRCFLNPSWVGGWVLPVSWPVPATIHVLG